MLGLPSTTEVGRRLPKEAFYRNLKLSAKQKDAFVHGVERIEILSSLKESTIHIPVGNEIEEIMVVGITLRDEAAAVTVVDEIAKANKHKLVFLCIEPNGQVRLAVRAQGVKFGAWETLGELSLKIQGGTLDEVWDSIVSQVAFGDVGTAEMTAESRIALAERVASLEKLVRELDAKCRRARQIGKKNELFVQMRKAEAELEQARKEQI